MGSYSIRCVMVSLDNRNQLLFEGVEPKWEDLIETIKMRTISWVKLSHASFLYSAVDIDYNLSNGVAVL